MNSKFRNRLTIPVTLAVALTVALAGCGGGNNNLALTQGNWSFAATSSQGAGTAIVGGNLTQNGSSVSATMYITGSCIAPSQQLSFSGTVKDKQVTLTSAPDPQGDIVNVTASGTTGSALTGTYTVTGGCANGDNGTVSGNAVPSITATWSGPLNLAQDVQGASVSIAVTQASTASADGTFALSGTLTFQNSVCEASGTITSGAIAGPAIAFTANTAAGDTITYIGGMLDSTTNPMHMTTGTYSVSGGACDGDADIPTFTKQ